MEGRRPDGGLTGTGPAVQPCGEGGRGSARLKGSSNFAAAAAATDNNLVVAVVVSVEVKIAS